jgi:hypothetical protein
MLDGVLHRKAATAAKPPAVVLILCFISLVHVVW